MENAARPRGIKPQKENNSIQKEAEKKIKRLKENPTEIGKPLKYFQNLFELHIRMYRIFYVVAKSQVKVLVLAVEHKDVTDDYLRNLSPDEILRKLSNQ